MKFHGFTGFISTFGTGSTNHLDLPSGKRLQKRMENHHVEWVNQLFLWAIFNSYVCLAEGKPLQI